MATRLRDELEPSAIQAFAAEAKIGILATITPSGHPHLTLITSLRAKDPRTLMWGQFTEGLSKENVRGNPHTGYLVLTKERGLWRGKARWTHCAREGDDYVLFNSLPMFRYNAYFGIHTVHYMDVTEAGGRESLPLGSILAGYLLAGLGRKSAGTGREGRVLRPWAEELFNSLTAVKFLSWIGEDGFPAITPVIQARSADSARLVFSPRASRGEADRIPTGATVAVFGVSLKAEDVLVRGTFGGIRRFRGIRLGVVDIDWVYNSMPPAPGQIYPEVRLEPVVKF